MTETDDEATLDDQDMQEWLDEEAQAAQDGNPYLARVEQIRQRQELARQERVRDRAAELAHLAERPLEGEILSPEDWEFILEGVPKNTRSTYRNAWKWILAWTAAHGYPECPMPYETCVKMIRGHWHRTGRYGRPAAPSTLQLTLVVLTLAHQHAKRPDGTVGYVTPVRHPNVQRAVRSYRKRWLKAGHRPDKASPITPEELTALVDSCARLEERGARDALALTLLYDMGARRSELLAIDFEDVDLVLRDPSVLDGVDWTRPEDIDLYVPEDPEEAARGDRLIVHVPMSKTDQEGAGDEVILLAHPAAAAASCPVRRFIAWRALVRDRGWALEGPLLRTVLGGRPPKEARPRKWKITGEGMDVGGLERMLVRALRAAGMVGVEGRARRHFALHGLRAGSMEAAAEGGSDTPEMNRHYRLSQKGTTAQQYAARGLKRKRNPARRIWASR